MNDLYNFMKEVSMGLLDKSTGMNKINGNFFLTIKIN